MWCKPSPIVLVSDATVDDALLTIATACRNHWQANLAAALVGEHPEGIHQVRVGLRRFRVFLTLFSDYLPSDQLTWLKTEAKALGDALGPARDLDVFLAELMEPLSDKGAHDANVAILMRTARNARNDAHAAAVVALTSKRYSRFMTRLNTWLTGRGWRRGDVRARRRSAESFARAVLNRRLAKIASNTKSIENMRAAKLHRLRIAVKKLRYGFEFFHAALPQKRTTRASLLLKGLQDSLGYVNDLDVAKRMLTMLSEHAADDQTRLAIIRGGRRLTATFDAAAKAARPQAVRIATRLRAQKPL